MLEKVNKELSSEFTRIFLINGTEIHDLIDIQEDCKVLIFGVRDFVGVIN